MPDSLLAFAVRRWAARLWGDGPIGLATMAELTSTDRTALDRGVTGPESYTGKLRSETGDTWRYRRPASLLGQEAAYRFTAGQSEPPEGWAPSRPKQVYALEDAGVVSNQGLVYCRRSRRAVAETAALWTQPARRNPLLAAARFPSPVHLPGVSLSLLARSTESYYHFLNDALPRLHLAADLLGQIDHIIVNGAANSFASAWLDYVGVPAGKRVWASPLSHFRCNQLIFTGDLAADQQPTPWNLRALRSILRWRPPAGRGRRLVWLSRKSAAIRRLAWEAELLRQLPEFEVHDLTALSPAAQLELFREAALVAGPHGAGMANVAFCPPGAVLVELFPEFPLNPLYSRWADLSGMSAYWAQVEFDSAHQLDALATALRSLIAGLGAR